MTRKDIYEKLKAVWSIHGSRIHSFFAMAVIAYLWPKDISFFALFIILLLFYAMADWSIDLIRDIVFMFSVSVLPCPIIKKNRKYYFCQYPDFTLSRTDWDKDRALEFIIEYAYLKTTPEEKMTFTAVHKEYGKFEVVVRQVSSVIKEVE